MRREDLRKSHPEVLIRGHYEVTPAEFDVLARAWAVERGWVEPKACGECDGAGWLGSMMSGGSPKSCPSCGGTGREPLCVCDACEERLAALEGGTDV